MMISEAMQDKLNAQVKMEFGAEHKYLGIAAALDARQLKLLAARFWAQAAEEHGHAMKIVNYLMGVGAMPEFRGVDEPKNDYDSVEEMAETALEAEQDVTKSINEIVALAEEEKDYATRSFLQWFVDEQVEEVDTMTTFLEMVRMAGDKRLFLAEGRIAGSMGAE